MSPVKMRLTGPPADPTVVTSSIGDVPITFDEAAGDTISPSGAFLFFQKSDDSAEGIIDPRRSFVTDARLRTEQGWEESAFDGGVLLVGVDGALSDTRPVDDTVEYFGQAIGYAQSFAGDLFTLRLDVTIDTGFANSVGTFSTDSAVIFSEASPAISTNFFNLSGIITIDGSSLSGAVSPNDAVSTAQVEGTVFGAFYGPESAEAGGVIEASSLANDTAMIASFSAEGTPVP